MNKLILPKISHLPIFSSLALLMLAPTYAAQKSSATKEATSMEANFSVPPTDSRPRTWWHWINENVTEDGITKDLEAMKRIGLKGAQITNIYQGGPPEAQGEDVILSPAWIKAVEHAAKECKRLGLTLGASSAAGCSGSGGPWITPELSMQEVVWRHKFVKGPVNEKIALPQPQINDGFYRDIAVLAFPTLPGDAVPVAALHPEISSDIPGVDWSAAIDGNDETFVTLPKPKNPKESAYVVFKFPEPVSVGSLSLQIEENSKTRTVKLFTSDDGVNWAQSGMIHRWRSEFVPDREELIEGVPAKTARFVKLEFLPSAPAVPMNLYELNFQSSRLKEIHTKAARMRAQPEISNHSKQVISDAQQIPLDKIVDLTDRLLPNGELDCRLPEGDWTILRFGHTTNGNEVKPASDRSKGLEVDKMDAEAMEYHFKEGMLGKMCKFLGPLTGKVFVDVNIDSWEAGCQTWTRKFLENFSQRRGYDGRKWLITLTGRIVGNIDLTERFLWDYRRTIGDLIAENFYGKMREMLNKEGIKLEAEAPGTGTPCQVDQIQCLGKIDIPQGEFWIGGVAEPTYGWKGGNDNTKEPAVAAHVYGKNIVSCEAFTSFGHHDGWTQFPYQLKPVGDRQFCNGMNEVVFHRYAHQPDDRFPGMSLGQFGLNFERTLTWWEQGRAWVEYLSRCQYMLRQGRAFADVCYYYGEDVPNTAWYFVPGVMDPRQKMKPVLPIGYDYDVCDRTILDLMRVEDGVVVLPSGMRYKYLVLPDSARYTPAALEKVLELVMAGATVIGPKPSVSPSLSDYPNADKKIQELAAQIWPQTADASERRVGKGRVITEKSFEKILQKDGLRPDFKATSQAKDSDVQYTHRVLPKGDLYFVSNLKDRPEEVVLDFRVTGMVPELWDPATGKSTELAMYQDDGTSTTIPLRLDSSGSQFFVFKKAATKKAPVVELLKDGQSLRSVKGGAVALPENTASIEATAKGGLRLSASEAGRYTLSFADGSKSEVDVQALPAPEIVPEKWNVTFQKDRSAPEGQVQFDKLESWTKRPEDGIRYFSGTATYEQGVNVSKERLQSGKRVFLDLGDVLHLAEVFVNDKPLGVLWKPPYRVDITDVAKPGANKIEVRVTNVWKNRLIGDQKLPAQQRITWTFYPFYKADAPLVESGLLGPVRLLSAGVNEVPR